MVSAVHSAGVCTRSHEGAAGQASIACLQVGGVLVTRPIAYGDFLKLFSIDSFWVRLLCIWSLQDQLQGLAAPQEDITWTIMHVHGHLAPAISRPTQTTTQPATYTSTHSCTHPCSHQAGLQKGGASSNEKLANGTGSSMQFRVRHLTPLGHVRSCAFHCNVSHCVRYCEMIQSYGIPCRVV